MSIFQVISMTRSMYWDQWDFYTQVEYYERVYVHIQRTSGVPSDQEVLALMPPVLQNFRAQYIRLKKTINEWEKTTDPEQFLLEQTLIIKAMELKNQALEHRISSLTSQIESMDVSSPGHGKGSSSSGSMPTIHEEVKETSINIFSPGAQFKRSAGSSQRTE